jgi:hypothetical protein
MTSYLIHHLERDPPPDNDVLEQKAGCPPDLQAPGQVHVALQMCADLLTPHPGDHLIRADPEL